jgi:undecaprenyl-diphosphatase
LNCAELVRVFDSALLSWVAGGQGALSSHFFFVLTWAGSILLLMPLALAWSVWAYRQHWPRAAFLPLALGSSSLAAFSLKILVDRSRPDLFPPLSAMPADASFPSAHTMQVTAFVLALWLAYPWPQPWRRLLALLGSALVGMVGYSRLHLQLHFPSDVLAGVLLATLLTLGLHAIYPATARPAA